MTVDWAKLIYTAGFAGLVAVLATVVIERFGGKLGGVLATLPTTIIPASLGFWYLSPTIDGFTHAMWSVPMGMLLNAAFLHAWRWVPKLVLVGRPHLRLAIVFTFTVGFWLLLALGTVLILKLLAADLLAVGMIASAVQLGYGAVATEPSPTIKSAAKQVSVGTLIARGLMASLAIAAATFIIAIGNPILAGVASVFPAIFLTVMVSVWLSQGENAPKAAIAPMMMGSVSVSAYALLSSWLFTLHGPIGGALMAWVMAVGLVSLPTVAWLGRKTQGSSLTD